jgi:organic hydroperoxide reductase OsmC/OhrA
MFGESSVAANRIDDSVRISIEPVDDGFTIRAMQMQVSATTPREVQCETSNCPIETTKASCAISSLFSAAITVDAQLEFRP